MRAKYVIYEGKKCEIVDDNEYLTYKIRNESGNKIRVMRGEVITLDRKGKKILMK